MQNNKRFEDFFKESQERVEGFVKGIDEFFAILNAETPLQEVCRTIGDFPKINVINYGNEIKVVAAIAGYSKDEISISFMNNQLFLSTKKSETAEQPAAEFLIREIKKSGFKRAIYLPTKYKYVADGIKAKFENGLLSIWIPKLTSKPEEKKSTEIKID